MTGPLVEGIGGVFLDSYDAAALAGWYRRHLGIDFQEHPEENSHYVVFRTRDLRSGEIRENPVFAISPAEGKLAPPQERGFVVNLRVKDLDRTLADLAAAGVTVEDQRIAWEGGKHGWIRDLDGNRIELYEELPLAPDSPYRTAGPSQ
jgi:catechol 2,3-dioxygenase-like lactoylglutathione lyase family enzyme